MSKPASKPAFPANFVWGVATSAFQIEARLTRMDAVFQSGTPFAAPPAKSITATPATSPVITTTCGNVTWT